MSGFSFRLSRIEKLRERAEKAALGELAGCLRRVEDAERHLAALADERLHVANKRNAAVIEGRLDPILLAALQREAEGVAERIAARRIQRVRAIEAVEKARALAGDKHRDRKALEILREREWSEWAAEVEVVEQQQMDEVAADGFARRKERR